MSEWKKVKLGECCEITSSKRCHASERSKEGIPFYCSKEIIQLENGEEVRESDYIPVELYESIKHKYGAPKQGDLLLTTRGTNGIPYVYKDKDCFYFADGNLSWFKNFKTELSVRFLYYWFKSYIGKHSVDSIAKGTAQKAVPIEGLRNLEIELPTYSTQCRIATILSRYDSLIENYQKQIKLLEESAQRLYKEWFIDLCFPGHGNTKIVDGVPEGWEKKKIKDLVDLKSGYAFKSSAFVEKGKYKIVTIKNVKDGVFDGDNVSYLNSVPEKMPSHCILQTGDILLSLTGNVGRICMVVGDNYLLNQRVAKLESNFPAFTYCHFRYYDTFVAINNLANGAAQQNVSPIRIGDLNIIIANDDIIHRFENVAENIRTNILNLSLQIRHLTEARDRLLPKLMSGEIEIKVYTYNIIRL